MNIWRERLNRWLAPAAARIPFSPNTITAVALILNISAAACLGRGGTHPVLFLVAIPLLAIGGLADALDGIVARTQNRTTRFGDFLDHSADRLSDTLLAAGWLYGSHVRQPLLIVILVAVMMNGYLGTQIEATYGRRTYDQLGRGEFVVALTLAPIVSYVTVSRGLERPIGPLSITEWLAALLLVAAIAGIVQRLIQARALERS